MCVVRGIELCSIPERVLLVGRNCLDTEPSDGEKIGRRMRVAT
jgi:hypothetical protein